MTQTQTLAKTTAPLWLKILVITIVSLSIFFRFTNLGQKIYCGDESWTSVAISGHTLNELKQEISDSEGVVPITIFNKYQHINTDRNVGDTVNYLVTSDPQHPPLYYVMVRIWVQIFGDSPTGIRSLSAVISLLIFPCVYWLCLELFESHLVGWVAIALFAVSPLQLYFAQEARQYCLWMVEILLSSAALLRSIRLGNVINWIGYSLALTLGLYTHLFTILVAIAHGIYILIQQQLRLTKVLGIYLIASIVAFLMFSPWLIVILSHIQTAINLTNGWSFKLIDNQLELISIFLVRVAQTFFDLNVNTAIGLSFRFSQEGSLFYRISELVFLFTLLGKIIYFLVKSVDRIKIIFILLLGFIPSIFLISFDLYSGGFRSIQIRYQLPLCISLEISVAYILCFYTLIENSWQQKIAKFAISALLVAGLVADVKFFQSESWWTQSSVKYIAETVQSIQKPENSLLVINQSPIDLGGILALSKYLPKLSLLVTANNYMKSDLWNYNTIFFMHDNINLFHQIEQIKTYKLKTIRVLDPPGGGLWQFQKISNL